MNLLSGPPSFCQSCKVIWNKKVLLPVLIFMGVAFIIFGIRDIIYSPLDVTSTVLLTLNSALAMLKVGTTMATIRQIITLFNMQDPLLPPYMTVSVIIVSAAFIILSIFYSMWGLKNGLAQEQVFKRPTLQEIKSLMLTWISATLLTICFVFLFYILSAVIIALISGFCFLVFFVASGHFSVPEPIIVIFTIVLLMIHLLAFFLVSDRLYLSACIRGILTKNYWEAHLAKLWNFHGLLGSDKRNTFDVWMRYSLGLAIIMTALGIISTFVSIICHFCWNYLAFRILNGLNATGYFGMNIILITALSYYIGARCTFLRPQVPAPATTTLPAPLTNTPS